MPCFNAKKTVSAYVADTVLELMQNGGTGEVIMVNSAGVYLDVGANVWLLCDISWGAVPIGIAIENFEENIKDLHIEQGQSFVYREKQLIFSGRELYLRLLPLGVRENNIEEPRLDLIRQAAQDIVALHKVRGISMLVSPLLLKDEIKDTVLLNPYSMREYPLLLRLM